MVLMTLTAPPAWLTALLLLWIGQSLWSAWNVTRFRRRLRLFERRRAIEGSAIERALVIVPVKGAGDLARHVEGLAAQRHIPYRLTFVVESEADPAHALLRELIAHIPRSDMLQEISLLVAGRPARGGQKVHNQLCALRSRRPDDSVAVFADADAVPGPDWLQAMVTAAMRPSRGAATSYRWMVPDDNHLATRVGCVINASVATMFGRDRWNHAWGGSMAIRRDIIEQSDLIGHLDGALSDDYQLSRAVRATGFPIYFTPLAMPLSPVHFSWSSLFEFGRRQLLITRTHAPGTWWGALGVSGFYLTGWAAALWTLLGLLSLWGLCAAGLVMLFDLARGLGRRAVFAAVFEEQNRAPARDLAGIWWLECLGTPIWMGIFWMLIVSSAFGRRIRWAGIEYAIHGPQDVRILRRDDTPPSMLDCRTMNVESTSISDPEGLVPGALVQVTQQIPQRDDVWTSQIVGRVVRYGQSKTGSWFAHSRHDKLWLDRLTLRKTDGETIELNLDAYSHIEILEPPTAG